MKIKRLVCLSLACATVLFITSLTGFAVGKSTLRNETLYVNGLQWGAPPSFNILSGTTAFPIQYANGMELVYESLFMFNQLTGELEPLLGTKYTWTDDLTLRVKLNPHAHFNNGEKFTSADAVYSFMLGKRYKIPWSSYANYFDDVKINANNNNKLSVLDSLGMVPMLPHTIWNKIEEEKNHSLTEIIKVFNENPVGTGPYKIYFYDDTKITISRDDKYWGKSLFGKLAKPKYITHVIYKDNNAGNAAFQKGEVDMSAQYIPNITTLQKKVKTVKTYLNKAPYYVPGAIPSLWFNMHKPALDNVNIRKAIAMCIDYDQINKIAMSGYSGKVVPGIVLQTKNESRYVDKNAVKSLQWTTDISKANELLDKIGAAKGPDGIRVFHGTKLSFSLECPYGYSDWQAALEIVAQCAKKVGIEMKTQYPDYNTYTNKLYTGNFDIATWRPAGAQSPSQPWARARDIMYSVGVPKIGEMAFWNFGRYQNDRADKLVKAIPSVSDATQLKSMFTELTKIYLTDIPTIPLMYRAWYWYTVNEAVWTGFPNEKDGTHIPPQTLFSGAGIKGLYKLKLRK
jgi:peptide/nickel transport system substrate-binding protein